MKGSIYKSVSNSGRTCWRYQIDKGQDEYGKRVRLTSSGFKLEREAYDAMRDAMREQPGRVNTRQDVGRVHDGMAAISREGEAAITNNGGPLQNAGGSCDEELSGRFL